MDQVGQGGGERIMPTNRSRRSRKLKSQALSDAMQFFLENGKMPPLDFPYVSGEKFEIFMLWKRDEKAMARIKNLWFLHGDEILKDWTRLKRHGFPWALKQLKKEN